MKINEVISPNRPTLMVAIDVNGSGESSILRRLNTLNPGITKEIV